MAKYYSVKDIPFEEMRKLLPANTTFGDIWKAIERLHPDRLYSVEELVVEVNLATRERLSGKPFY